MFLSEAEAGIIPTTLWAEGSQFGFNQDGVREVRALGLDFPSPKPEALMSQVLHVASREGDLIFDSFLGSGTTAAVAHKMGRRRIGVEMGEHAATHCLPRLKKVVEGEQGGISEAVGWKGGGGFRFMKLGEPAFGADGRISPGIRFATLAAYLWFLEAGNPHPTGKFNSPLLGVHNGTAIVLLYNGILGDRRPDSGNVLTQTVWKAIIEVLPPHNGPRMIYGEACRLSAARLRSLNATFRQISYDIRMR